MIGLYCPDVPPARGGVSDHTLVLARALERLGSPPVVLAHRGDPARFAPIPCVTGLTPGDVAGAAAARGVTSLVIQYVPFLFARRGVSPALVSGARRAQKAGIRLAMILHEPYVPFTRLPWLVTGVLQRLQLRLLLGVTERVYTGVPHFAELARRHGGRQVEVAPIGATIPASAMTREEARRRLGIGERQVAIGIFSPGASGYAHDWIAAAARRLHGHASVRWVRFGHGSGVARPGYPDGSAAIIVGEGSPEQMADTMRAMDLQAAPYTDGLTLRRSGAMLALASGVPLVSSEGPLFDPRMRALAACEPHADAFAERLARLADSPLDRAEWQARAGGYADAASVESLAARLLKDLERAA